MTDRNIDKVRASLEKLASLGLAIQEGQHWKAVHQSFRVPEHLGSKAVQTYHAEILQSAIAAQSLPNQMRRFRSLLIALNEKELAEMFSKMNEVAESILSRHNYDHFSDRKLFQFNMNIFPTTLEQTK